MKTIDTTEAQKRPDIEAQKADLFAFFETCGIAHTTHTHKAVFTVEESEDIKAHLPGGHTKNLFLKDKKGVYFLICALGNTQIPVNQLHKHLDCKRLSFGKPEALLENLGVTPGSVTLFALINDRTCNVQLILDKALFSHDVANFHPLTNTATTAITSADMLVFAKETGHNPIILDFDALTAGLEPNPKAPT